MDGRAFDAALRSFARPASRRAAIKALLAVAAAELSMVGAGASSAAPSVVPATTAPRRRRVASVDISPTPPDDIASYTFPGPETMQTCQHCLDVEARNAAICYGSALAVMAGCVIVWTCPALAAASVLAYAGCAEKQLIEHGACVIDDCCPTLCAIPNPLEPGSGCCDHNEHCVNINDPNARAGCCPSDQLVCAGQCCAKGETCCGETCCPANYYCLHNGTFCSQHPGDSLWPRDENGNPIPPPVPPPDPNNPNELDPTRIFCAAYQYECMGQVCCDIGLGCCQPPWSPVPLCSPTNCLH